MLKANYKNIYDVIFLFLHRCRISFQMEVAKEIYLVNLSNFSKVKYWMAFVVKKLKSEKFLEQGSQKHTSYLSFFYTNTLSGLEILLSKVRKFATKICSRQNSVNYTLCVKLHTVCKIYTLCVILYTVCKITHCEQNYTLCKLHTVCKITHSMCNYTLCVKLHSPCVIARCV